ncbi:helix-turn-helix transcriptional regulator [Zhihengliuella halotolerans]|uniref:WYL domain-containing protein n=1 Tax=Zhihengliuella halotolerans TaxID=370736 RepID=A0A4Q8ABJ4_9MICC|nr:WYL domain-containing protein [Zhihengliuella halotolerans]RZU60945.1 WYL domain-containing protein [Zhihengliuella halotolerans]
MADVTKRMLDLLAALQAGRAFSGEELATRLEVSPRTLRRDVERLRGYGYPVHARPGPGGSYQLGAGRRMPPLVLDDEEAVATVVSLAVLAAATYSHPGGLNDAADRAYGKIDDLLPRRLRTRVAALRASVEAERRPFPDIAAEALGEIAEAAAAEEIIVFDYIDAHGVSTQRRIEAHRQIHIDRRWYVFGWDLNREDWRVFRTDRVKNMRRTGRHYAPRSLPMDWALAYLRAGLGDI